MHRMRDECLVVLLLLPSMLVSGARGLYISLESATKQVNETFVVVCKDEEARPVTWQGSKGLLDPSTRPMVLIGNYGTSIIFNNTLEEDSGTYTCSTGEDRREFHLSVKPPLVFKDTSTTQVGEEGKPFTLRCEVRGGTIRWSAEGVDLSDEKKFKLLGDGLLIKRVHRSDNKTYICKGLQLSTGTVIERKILLRVQHKPVSHPKYVHQGIVYGYINGTVNLSCNVEAEPEANFEWLKIKDKSAKIANVNNKRPNHSILQLRIEERTFGDYKCMARNKFGTLETRYTLEKGTKPLAPQNVTLKASRANLLLVEIRGPESGGGMEAKGFHLQYKRVEDLEWKQHEYNVTEDNFYSVEDLDSNTEYEVRAATINLAGPGDYSEAFRFYTSGAIVLHLSSCCPLVVIMLLEMYGWAFW